MKIFLPHDTLLVVKEKYIIVDTCLFLEFAFLTKEEKSLFIDGLNLLRGVGCSLLTIEPVETEFYIGSNIQDLEVKKEYLKLMKIETVYPQRLLDAEAKEKLLVEYGDMVKGSLSYVDFCLGIAAKQFPKSLILTRNYKDFPGRVFQCVALFSISLDKNIKTYGFYQYGKTEYQNTAKLEVTPF